MLHKVGIDLGGTKTEIIVLDETLNVLERKRVPTPKDNYEKIIQNIVNLVNDVSQNISDFSVGVCCPGAISKNTGLIKNSNTQCLIGKSLKKDLENKLKKIFLLKMMQIVLLYQNPKWVLELDLILFLV